MNYRQSTVNTLKKGSYLVIDDAACVVKDISTSKPGKHGSAKAKIKAVGLLDEKKRIIVKPAKDNIKVPIVEKNDAQVLSVSGDTANVMDMKTYETFDLKVPEELEGKVEPNGKIIYWDVLGEKVMREVKN
ncbi:MAG: translation initiation factor IF-5A [Candidatus Woesearchaeota archaeon]